MDIPSLFSPKSTAGLFPFHFQYKMSWQTIYHDLLVVALDQWLFLYPQNPFVTYVVSLFIQLRNQFFFICDSMHIIDSCGTIYGSSDTRSITTILPVSSSSAVLTAALPTIKAFINIHTDAIWGSAFEVWKALTALVLHPHSLPGN